MGFATSVESFVQVPGVGAALSDPNAALGAPDTGFVSLGDADPGQMAGSITLGFDQAITDGAGADFAVFENAFLSFNDPSFVFAELAFVEVSTNGIDFARFPTTSLTTLPDPIGEPVTGTDLDATFGLDFATIPAANVAGFAGVDLAGQGTLFDLGDLAGDALVLGGLLDLSEINFVRLRDIPGDGRFVDSNGNPIFDSFDPGNVSGGFDLDAVGVINQVPEPGGLALLAVLSGLTLRRRSRNKN